MLAAPHYVAQGTIDAMVDVEGLPDKVRIDYQLAGTAACGIITSGKSREDLAEFIVAAIKKNDAGFVPEAH